MYWSSSNVNSTKMINCIDIVHSRRYYGAASEAEMMRELVEGRSSSSSNSSSSSSSSSSRRRSRRSSSSSGIIITILLLSLGGPLVASFEPKAGLFIRGSHLSNDISNAPKGNGIGATGS